MRHLKFLLILVILYSFSACLSEDKAVIEIAEEIVLEDNQPQYVDYDCDIGTIALQIEESVGFVVNEVDYELIQTISADVYDNIVHQQVYSEEEAKEVLAIIHQMIGKHMAVLTTYHSVFSTCLRYRIFDCDILSLLYLSVAENLGLPIHGMLTPSHMFIVWEDPRRSFRLYWETTEGQERALNYYLEKYNFDKSFIGSGMNFSVLNKESLVSVIYFNIAKEYTDLQKRYDRSNQFCYASLKRAPEWTNPLHIIAHNYYNMGIFDSSTYYSKKGISICRDVYESNYLLAKSYEKQGCINEALDKYRFSLSLLPAENHQYDSTDLLEDIKRLSSI